MTLVEVRHDDALTFWYSAVRADELPVLPHRVDLEQGELILSICREPIPNTEKRIEIGSVLLQTNKREDQTHRVEIARIERSTVFQYFDQAFLDSRQLVCLAIGRSHTCDTGTLEGSTHYRHEFL